MVGLTIRGHVGFFVRLKCLFSNVPLNASCFVSKT